MSRSCVAYQVSFRLLSSIAALALLAGPTLAQTFTVNSGTVDNTAKTLSGTQTGTVQANGTLSVSGSTAAITWNNTSTAVVLTNSGTIEQTGTGRGFDSSGNSATLTPRNLTFINNAGASLTSAVQDAFRINTAVTGGVIDLQNYGLIRAAGTGFTGLGQALDLRSIVATSGVTLSLTNYATGVIEAYTDDAIRPGQNMTIHNFGIIRSGITDTAGINSGSGAADGIDAGGNTGVVVTNEAGATISGARHGITADTDITVINSGTIIGRNGSGVGSDGTGTVTNYGTITGAYAGAGHIFLSGGTPSINGDGDGVDIDKLGTVNNYGTIQGIGAGGVDSGGIPNSSQGIAMGGGIINNYAGALISGAGSGILIDDGSDGNAFGAITIANAGTIRGLDGAAIKVVGPFTNTITNQGLITAAGSEATIMMGAGNDTVTNSGTIVGSIDLGGGTNVVSNLAGGASISVQSSTLAAPTA